jgi:Mitochondrial K+-H+ exchange-related
MLARLWSARRIDLRHPASRSSEAVRAIWSDYLRQQGRRHLAWFAVNGFIAPFAFWLFILPGPNLIGYWFAYRTIHHLIVVWGIARVRWNKVATELCPIAALDVPIEHKDDGKAAHIALSGSAARLDEHVAWHSSAGRVPTSRQRAVAPPSAGSQPAHSHAETSSDG